MNWRQFFGFQKDIVVAVHPSFYFAFSSTFLFCHSPLAVLTQGGPGRLRNQTTSSFYSLCVQQFEEKNIFSLKIILLVWKCHGQLSFSALLELHPQNIFSAQQFYKWFAIFMGSFPSSSSNKYVPSVLHPRPPFVDLQGGPYALSGFVCSRKNACTVALL